MDTETAKVAPEQPQTQEVVEPKEQASTSRNPAEHRQVQKTDTFTSEYLDKKIDELVEQRLKERDISYRQKIEDAQRMIDEANERKALEDQLMESERYSQINEWQKNKEEQFKRELAKLGEMGRRNMHMSNMYQEYDMHKSRAARGDQRSIDMLGVMNLVDACMRYTPDQLLNIYKRNIGVVD